jgi:hypothetical protein
LLVVFARLAGVRVAAKTVALVFAGVQVMVAFDLLITNETERVAAL